MKKTCILIFTVLLFLIISSCKNTFGEKNESKGSITFNFNCEIEGAVSKALQNNWNKEKSRTAQPVLPSEIQYKVTGLKTNDSVYFTNTTEHVYDLQFGTYSIDVEGYIKDASGEYTVKAFKSNSPAGGKIITINDTNPDGLADFILTPVFDSSTNGTVELPIVVETAAEITKITAEWRENGIAKTQTFTTSDFINDPTTSTDSVNFTMEGLAETDGVKAGVYSVVFSFYKYSAGTEILSYRLTETINVFSNLTTDCWKKVSESEAYMTDVDSDGFLEISVTKALVTKFEQTVKYVDTENGSDVENSGTYFAPYKTIQHAVNVINQQNEDSTSSLKGENFSIILKNNVTDNNTNSYLETDSYALVNINPTANLNLTISSYDANNICVINANRSEANGTGRVMFIGDNANVTLENVELTGGYLKDTADVEFYGAGIYVSTAGKLMLGGKIAVYGNNKKAWDSVNEVNSQNIYLPKNSDDTQSTVKITGVLEQSANGKIGITTENWVSNTDPVLIFTEGFAESNNLTPSNFFVSDENYAIGYDTDVEEAVIAISGGSFNFEISDDVKLSLTRSGISQKTETRVPAKAYLNNDITHDENFSWCTDEIKVFAYGKDVTDKITVQNNDDLVLVFPANVFVKGDAIQVFLKANYKNKKYSTSTITLSVNEESFSTSEGKLAEYIAGFSASQTADVFIDDFNPDLEVLKNLVTTSAANISLNLSSCTDLTVLPKDCFDITNPNNKLTDLYLPSTVTKYVDLDDIEQSIASPEIGGTNGETNLRYAILYAPESGTEINVTDDMEIAKPVPIKGKVTLKADTEDVTITRQDINAYTITIDDANTELIIGGGEKTVTIDGNNSSVDKNAWTTSTKSAVQIKSGTVTLKENSLLYGYKSNEEGFIQIDGGTLNIEGGKISNFYSGSSNTYGSAVRVNSGTLNFSAGLIGNEDSFHNEGQYGAVYLGANATFNMSGTAKIKNSWGRFGGALFCKGKFTMTGGSFENNRAWGSKSGNVWGGGAIYSDTTAIVDLQAGRFIGNYTETTASSIVMPGGAVKVDSGTIKISSAVEFIDNKTFNHLSGEVGNNGNHYFIQSGSTFYLDGVKITELPYRKN